MCPTVQGSHAVELVAGANVPTSHASQLDDAGNDEYQPASQTEQCKDPGPAYVPAGHSAQTSDEVEEEEGLNVPEGQRSQRPELESSAL